MGAVLTLEIRRGAECRHYALTDPVIDLGRAEDNRVILNDPLVSRHHARLEWNAVTHGITITDLGSINATRVGENTITPQVPQPLKDGDAIQIGGYSLRVHLPSIQASHASAADEPTLILSEQPTSDQPPDVPRLIVTTVDGSHEFPLSRETLIIGRDPASDIVIADRIVSRRHAQLWRVADGYEIADLASANGLLFKGKRIANKLLADSDVLWIGPTVSLTYHTAAPINSSPSAAAQPDAHVPVIRSTRWESLHRLWTRVMRHLNLG